MVLPLAVERVVNKLRIPDEQLIHTSFFIYNFDLRASFGGLWATYNFNMLELHVLSTYALVLLPDTICSLPEELRTLLHTVSLAN